MANGYWVKKHGSLLAVCDEDLLGKKIGFGIISAAFYKGELVDKTGLKDILPNYTNMNVIGKESVKILIEQKIVTKKEPMLIDGIPHVQVIIL